MRKLFGRVPKPSVIRWMLRRGGTAPLVGNYNAMIKRGLYRAGIPVPKHVDVLKWAIGDDFYDLSIEQWPERLRTRLGIKIEEDQRIIDIMLTVGYKWKSVHNV